MYEHFRNELTEELAKKYASEDISYILAKLDKISERYEIKEKCTQLAVCQEEEIPYIVKMYIASRGVAGLSQKTLENKTIVLRMFLRETGKAYQDMTINDIRLWLYNHENASKVSKATIEKYRQTINTFYQWCVDEEYMQKNPCKNIGTIRTPYRHKNALTQNEIETVRESCRNDYEKALVEFLLSSGCRVSEMTGIRLSEVDWNNRTTKVIGKGNKERSVYFSVRAQRSMQKYINGRKHTSDYLFCSSRKGEKLSNRSVENTVKGIATRCGDELKHKLTPHTFRHTFATVLLNNTAADITTVSKALGHANISTTQVYLDMDNTKVQQSVTNMVC